MNICFITNYQKTFFFEALAKELEKDNNKVFWIVLNHKLYNHLNKSFDSSQLLLINKSFINKNNDAVGEYKLNELKYSDRVLKYYKDWPYKYMRNIQLPVYNFILQNNIKFVFGETTYAHEILINRIVKDKKELNCIFLHPQNIRIPNNYFTFLTDEFQSEIFKNAKSGFSYTNEEIIVEKTKESKLVEQIIKHRMTLLARIKRFLRFFTMANLEKDDPSISPSDFKHRFIKGSREELNRFLYKFVSTKSADELYNKKYVIYTLHKQPEASIDVVGRYYDDQYINIINIWRILPEDIYLVIKEHANAIGDREISFFKKIKKIPNIILINERENSHKLIQNAVAIFSVSGTISYEAALMGKPAFVFVPIFFQGLKNCLRITIDDLREVNSFYDLIERTKSQDKPNKDKFINELINYSYKGYISDPETSPDCMNMLNISNVVNGFKNILK